MKTRLIVWMVLATVACPLIGVASAKAQTGNLCVTVRNVGGNSVSGARVVRYPNGSSVYTPNCFNNIPTGTYACEAYYTGTFWGEEYWGDASVAVASGGTTNLTINRIYPYIESVTFRNHSTGTILNPSSQIEPGTTVRAEVVVRNKISVSLNVRVRMRLDRNQSSPYDSDHTSGSQSIGSNNTRSFTLTYTPTNTGTWYRAFSVITTLLNGNTPITDAWPWGQAFVVQEQTGSLRVTINPQGAIDAGAQWRVDGGSWHNSGYTQSGLSVGLHTISFRTVSGWNTPGSQQVSISAGQTRTRSGTYTQQTGHLCVTVRNVGGNAVSGARVVRYPDGSSVNTPNCFNGIPAGGYDCEAYYTGTFWGEEYWGDASTSVNSGSTTNLTIDRIYPYIESITFRNHSTNALINPTDQIPSGTTVRAEIVVRNKVSSPLNVRVRMLLDRNQLSPYEYDQTSSSQSVGSNDTRNFTLTYTPSQGGTWYRAFSVITTLLNGNTPITDAWPWEQAFILYSPPNVSLTSVDFPSERYQKGETVSAVVELHNDDQTTLNNIHLSIDFLNPDGDFAGGYESDAFDIPGLSSHTTPPLSLWQVPLSAVSGAYQTRIRVHSSSHETLAEFISGQHPAIPLLAVGDFPVLKNIIVRSQEHFSASDAGTVQSVLTEFSSRGLSSISLSVKLDDGPGLWPSLSPVPGQVLYSSSLATMKAQNPLTYDLYAQAQATGASIGVNINPWIPTFFDHAQSRYDHPEWKLLNDPPSAPNQDFVDAYIEAVRLYEHGLIAEVTGSPYDPPSRLTLDHFRFTNGQHGSDGIASITAFVQAVKSGLPQSIELAGYIWLPSDTWWSGQDYSQLYAYLDVFSPMLYWQDHQVNSTDDVPLASGQYIRSKVSEIRSVLGSSTTEQKVMPTISITTSVDFADGGNDNLEYYEWKRAQLNVLGAIADEGLEGYDLFYHGRWLWYVYPENPGLGRWIDWAQYLASLSMAVGALQVTDHTSLDHNWKLVKLNRTYQNPVIIVGPPTYHGTDPGVVRLQNVTNNSFDIRFQEWLYKDGAHIQENIPYLVISGGRHQMANGSIWEAGTFFLSGTGTWTVHAFTDTFPFTPALFLTTQTFNGSDPIAVRARNVTNTGFKAAFFEEENKMDGHTTEEVGYLAVYSPQLSGTVHINGTDVPYLLQAQSVDHRFVPVLSSDIKLEEEQSKDSEVNHIDETVSILALGDKIFTQDISSNGGDTAAIRRLAPEYGAAMEWGTVDGVDHNWMKIPLAKEYLNPVVVAKPVSSYGGDPGVIRIRNVSHNSFELRYNEWAYKDGWHTQERVFYMVVEAGIRSVAELTVEAKKLNTSKLLADGWEAITFSASFSQTPSVFTSVQTCNGADPVTTRLSDCTTAGFDLTMDEEEAKNDGHTTENIGWIAIEKGTGNTSDNRSIVVLSDSTNHIPTQINFGQSMARRFPIVVSDMITTYGADPCFLRYQNLGPSSIDLFIQEEQSADTEMNHTIEEVSVFVGE